MKEENEKEVSIPSVLVSDDEAKEIFSKSKKPKKEKKADAKRQQKDMQKQQKADKIQELDVYWKLTKNGAKLAIKLTKGERITVILKDPKYLKELRGHLQTVAKFGLRKNFI